MLDPAIYQTLISLTGKRKTERGVSTRRLSGAFSQPLENPKAAKGIKIEILHINGAMPGRGARYHASNGICSFPSSKTSVKKKDVTIPDYYTPDR